MNARISLYYDSTKVRDFPLSGFPLVVGRSPQADIVLSDRWVSRRHCEIDLCDGCLVVRDLGSKHGTLVNDCRISESPLLPGEKLHVGLSTFVASYDVAAAEAADIGARDGTTGRVIGAGFGRG